VLSSGNTLTYTKALFPEEGQYFLLLYGLCGRMGYSGEDVVEEGALKVK